MTEIDIERNGAIGTEQVTICLLCGGSGSQLYSTLSDRLFGCPGKWGFAQCKMCGLVWLSPRPLPEELSKVYETYLTHVDADPRFRLLAVPEELKRGLYATLPGYGDVSRSWFWRQVGRTIAFLPTMRDRACLGTMCLNGGHRGKLLDVGCGNGSFLAMMQEAGWEVTGVDPDKVAAILARKRFGISILNGSLEDAGFAEESFDAVTLSHVIEHVYDPVALLRECRRVLRPGGKIVVTTPNLASEGHRAFGSSWVPLDPPRHLHLFTSATLGACCERAGLSIQSVATSARGAGWVWAASKVVFKKGSFCRETDITLWLKIEGLAFQLREEKLQRTDVESGEELLLIATT